jgi:hypothetical protein
VAGLAQQPGLQLAELPLEALVGQDFTVLELRVRRSPVLVLGLLQVLEELEFSDLVQ